MTKETKNPSRSLVVIVLLVSAFAVVWTAVEAESAPMEQTEQSSSSEEVRDRDLAATVETDLHLDPGVRSHRIDAEVREGVVTLTGSVENLLERKRAAEIAERVRGVRAVVNALTVRPVIRADDELYLDVTQALVDNPATDAYELAVEVDDGIVTMTGTVDGYQERRLSELVVMGVSGVRSIENEIVVEPKGTRPDGEIQADIRERLSFDIWVDDTFVGVGVEDGVVTLDGRVGSAAEKRRVAYDALVAGVARVEDAQLKVDPDLRSPDRKMEEPKFREDEEILAVLSKSIAFDPRITSESIELSIEDGVVTMTGDVQDYLSKRSAEENAAATAGVWRVVNLIKVRPIDPLGDDNLSQRLRRALERHPYLSVQSIRSSVINGNAYLIGSVPSHFEFVEAERVATQVDGIGNVVNQLDIDPPYLSKSDWEIREDIERRIEWNPMVDASEVEIEVQAGVVTLTGLVQTWAERLEMEKIASAAGARRIDNDLSVQFGPDFYLP